MYGKEKNMYDTINGEKVNCFPWSSYCMPGMPINEHHGSMKQFENGDNVPYRSLSYNHGKNFVVLDVNPQNEDLSFAAHIIQDGKLVKSVWSDDIDDLDNYMHHRVVGSDWYYILNINSVDDVFKFISKLKKMKLRSTLACWTTLQTMKGFL